MNKLSNNMHAEEVCEETTKTNENIIDSDDEVIEVDHAENELTELKKTTDDISNTVTSMEQIIDQYHVTDKDNLLHESLVTFLEGICYEIDQVMLHKILISKNNYKEAQLSSLRCSNGKMHYLADYEDGNELRVNIGEHSVGSEFGLVVTEIIVANINNTEKKNHELLPEDVTLLDFTKQTHVKIGLHEYSPDEMSIDSSYDESELLKVTWEGEIGELLH